MNIEPLSPAVRDYLRAFDLTTIACHGDMRSGAANGRRASSQHLREPGTYMSDEGGH
jgi:hypothetical protein